MTITTRLFSDTPVTWLDRDTSRELGKGKLKAGTEIRIDGTKVYGPDGYLYRLEGKLEA